MVKQKQPEDYDTKIRGPIHRKSGHIEFTIKDYKDNYWWRYKLSRHSKSTAIFLTNSWTQDMMILDCNMVDELIQALQKLKALG
jgi:hypothetical protein